MKKDQWLTLPNGLWQIILGFTSGETRLNAIQSCTFFGQRHDKAHPWGETLALEFPEVIPSRDPKKWKAQYVASLKFSCINTPVNQKFIHCNNQRITELLECEDVQKFLTEQPFIRYTTLCYTRHMLTPDIINTLSKSLKKMMKGIPEKLSQSNMMTFIAQFNLIPSAVIYFDNHKNLSHTPIRVTEDFNEFSLGLFPEEVNHETPLGYAAMLLRPFLTQFFIDYLRENSIDPISLDPDLIIKVIAHPELPENHLPLNVIDLLIENGWNINYCIDPGFTALTEAIRTQKYHTALYLLDHGATFDQTSEMGNAAMLTLRHERLRLLSHYKTENPLIEQLTLRLEKALDLNTSLEYASSLTQ